MILALVKRDSAEKYDVRNTNPRGRDGGRRDKAGRLSHGGAIREGELRKAFVLAAGREDR